MARRSGEMPFDYAPSALRSGRTEFFGDRDWDV